ncbi:uncharacterized protein LOC112692327 isoform X2 [Sipha flava]|uniref:Uncharacterized protein LOC112692327 isoform X2 n=1 Tax=Sipha flava TaxID=143950 RepID=A0A2S2R6X0_9HEMI|nr:uncharacterized protein LOC112692327 isoform X2 [Sipha flava]
MTHRRRPVIVMLFFATILCIVTSLPASMNKPLVDPGLFVITGVETCGSDLGYCLLGNDCTMDDDFLPDPSGNCSGLKRAFTPASPFVCCKLSKGSLNSGPLMVDFNTKTSTEPKNELHGIVKNATPVKAVDELNIGKNVISISAMDKQARKTARENVDSSKIDNDQLAKLNQIELVVKKIIEQLINETANSMKVDETVIGSSEAKIEENTMMNEIKEDEKMFVNNSESTETGAVDQLARPEETLDDGQFKTEIFPENGEDGERVNESDKIEPETEESDIDDEFKAEKNICQKTCKSEVIFLVEKKPMCYGTLLDDIWVLTSATCASRLNKAAIRRVAVSRKDIGGATLSISNILVHENFKSPKSKTPQENNDLALVSLTVPLEGQECTPCFVQKKNNVINEVCKTNQNAYHKNLIKSAENCESRVQLRDMISNSYLILPCNSWRMQYNQEGRLGSGLWCDGKLAGVQTGVGVGSLIYTPVHEYATWISDNKRIERR